MASRQSEANRQFYEAGLARMAEQLPQQEAAERNDAHWTALTAEPGGVDYIEVADGGVRGLWLMPKGGADDRVILCIHGGGYVGGSMFTHRKMYAHLAKAVGCRALAIDYDFAYQSRFPRQLDQTLAAYRWLLAEGLAAPRIALAGDSTGGTLVLGLLQRLREAGLPQPAAALTISAWTDMAVTGESYETNRSKDAFFARQTVDWLAGNIVGREVDRREPHASPLYADLTGFPPLFMQVGADETLLDDSRVFAERARAAGVEVRLDIFADMLHSFQMMAGRAPEADEAIGRFAAWLRPRLGLAVAGREAA